ncbi:TPA: arginine--tRNA ligase, partial [Campylobacter jejuni]|nr:arginine--tRNA ligase [Campylobacter jejuni]
MKSIIFNEIKKILECDFALENPKDKNLAHFATPLAFSLAKELKKSPMLIASDLASKFQNHDCFELVEAVNGYLNFRISKTFLNELANQALTNPNDFTKGEKKQESFLLEYVSANPTGPLHIGHARGAVFGDTLTRLA